MKSSLKLFIIILVLSGAVNANDFEAGVILLSGGKGVLFPGAWGKTFKEMNRGLPGGIAPERVYDDGRGNLFLVSESSGLYRMNRGDESWTNISSGEFIRRSQVKRPPGCRKISAVAFSGEEPGIMTLATKHSLYMSLNSGTTWKEVKLRGLTDRNYITALGIRNSGKDIVAGTAFSGLFIKKGASFDRRSRGFPGEPYSGSRTFYEEVSSIAFDDRDPGVIYAGFYFGGGLYRWDNREKIWKALSLPVKRGEVFHVYDIKKSGNRLYVSTSRGIFIKDISENRWKEFNIENILKNIKPDMTAAAMLVYPEHSAGPGLYYKIDDTNTKKNKNLNTTAKGRRALYAGASSDLKRIKRLAGQMEKYGLNAIVLDLKDDSGRLLFNSENKTAKEIGAASRNIDIKKVLRYLKKMKIYSIARVVVFKDRYLFRAYNGKYAVWHRRDKKPWIGSPGEFWVDPHSEFVRSYNIDIAKELEDLGFDEIQFDYIRFPSDGPIFQCYYRYKKAVDMYKSEILSDFLYEAKKRLSVPVAVDIYGFNAWYRFGNRIGQDIEEFSKLADVICPMVYPSHFGNRFFMRGKREDRSYKIVYESGIRGSFLTDKRAILRPYLQAFNLLSPTFGPGYIKNQVKGASDSGCSGYLFWNAYGDYSVVYKALAKNK